MCTDALEHEPECVPLLVMRARAHIALRRDLDAQADLRDIIRLDPQCSLAYRLLGELAARRNANESASIFFREALRLDPRDREAADWLLVTDASLRPPRSSRPEVARHESAPRFARGTHTEGESALPPDAAPLRWGDAGMNDERPTQPFARGSDRHGGQWAQRTPAPAPAARLGSSDAMPYAMREQTQQLDEEVIPLLVPKHGELATIRGRPLTNTPPAKAAPRMTPRPVTRTSIPELPGFGEYLVSAGILTRERLRAAQAYQRSMKVQLSTAIVTLGLATPQRIEWASVSHQSQRARGQ